MKTWRHMTLVAAAIACLPAAAGTIKGKVHAEGKPGTDSASTSGAYGSRALKFAERIDYNELRDFVVYIEGPLTNAPATEPAPAPTAQVTTTKPAVSQEKAVFSPHILPVMAGTTVEWPNKDTIFHNVFSYSESKQFDLGLYKDPEVKKITFDKPGRVDVFCSIHANMSCVVLVVSSPYFSVTDGRGNYALTNVPAGTYTLKAWHERLPAQSRQIVVPENGEVKADFTLGITGLPKY
jgi:plastocyanin